MLKGPILRRGVLVTGALGVGAAAAAMLSRLAPAPSFASGPGDALKVYPPEGPQLVVDPSLMPRTYREAPALADLVRQGRLPPVAERIGLDPIVIQPLHEIGRYGGVFRRAFTGPGDSQTATRFASGPDSLLYWNTDRTEVVPNIARGYEMSRDGRVMTLFLRRGMRWSDGAPFTTDDIMFWFEDMHNDRRVTAAPSAALMIGDEAVRIERIDAATVQFVAPRPYYILPELLAGWTDIGGPSISGRAGFGGFAPKHYLSQFHPKYVEEAAIRRTAREAGFANWAIQLKSRNDWTLNPELPVVSPWRVVSGVNRQEFILERNPYSIWVDTAGNQLPYIDGIRHTYCAGTDAVSFKAGTGGLDEQDRHLSMAKLPFLLANRRRSDYDVYVDPFELTDLGMLVNLDYRIDPQIGALLKNREFRRALSLGVDREAINETLLLGLGTPSASVPIASNKYYPGDIWARRWATHDAPQANRMLDKLGLVARDGEGFRLRPDNRRRLRLVCQLSTGHFDYAAVGEMLRDQWRGIGVDLDVQVVEPNLIIQRCSAGEVQLNLQFTGTDDPFTYPEYLFPSGLIGGPAVYGREYSRWFISNGKAGLRPPPELQAMMDLCREGRGAPPERRIAIGQDMIRRHVDDVLSIGLISGCFTFYGVRVVRRAMGNVPRRVVNSHILRSPANGFPMTHYFRDLKRT